MLIPHLFSPAFPMDTRMADSYGLVLCMYGWLCIRAEWLSLDRLYGCGCC